MALSLGIQVGSRIRVGADELRVDSLLADGTIFVTINGVQHQVNDQRRTEILPGVYVSCGMAAKSRRDKMSKLAFEAPLSVRITRVPE